MSPKPWDQEEWAAVEDNRVLLKIQPVFFILDDFFSLSRKSGMNEHQES
jgi:hypothetical protein